MELKLPELGEGVHEGELVKWRVKEGDTVKDDQPIAEIMTDKATVELPSPFHGRVTKLMAKEGQVVKVGEAILSYEGAAAHAEAQAERVPARPQTLAPSREKPEAPITRIPQPERAPAPQAAAPQSAQALAAAPSTRRYAREMGVDLAALQGSGPAGRILREDVDRFLHGGGGAGAISGGRPTLARGPAPVPAAPKPRAVPSGGVERVPFRGLRKKIAEKMRESKDHAAHFTYVEECDATELVNLRNQAKEMGAKQGIKVTYLPFLMKAMVPALKAYPVLNSELDEEKQELIYKYDYNISISVQTEEGLTAPVVKDVANKSLFELAREIQDLVERARTKRLSLADLQGGTITITNAGSIGGLFATPVINYPEVAILGFNKIFRKPVVKMTNGREEVVVRDWTYFSISLDHRVVDGAIGAEFMKVFIRYIENPSLLWLESESR